MYKINFLIFPKLNIQMVLLKVEAPTVINNSIYKNKKRDQTIETDARIKNNKIYINPSFLW